MKSSNTEHLPILVSWVGYTDLKEMLAYKILNNLSLNAWEEKEANSPNMKLYLAPESKGENGPIRTISDSIACEKIYLLCSDEYYPMAQDEKKFVSRGTKAKIELINTKIKDPTNYEEIIAALNDFYKNHFDETRSSDYIFNITPGTPAMQAITLYMVANRFTGAKLYKTISKKFAKNGQQYSEIKLPFSVPSDLYALEQKSSATTVSDSTKDQIIQNYAKYRSVSILLLGETGVGKSTFAKEIYTKTGSIGNFIEVNCAEASQGDGGLFKAELFGYKKGAFTDAYQDKKGAFELACNGTLFLDEISEIPLHLQGVLLRAIQDKKIHPIGSDEDITIKDLRIITATNKDLTQLVKEGKFREDLYYRLAMCPIQLKPLREIAKTDEARFKECIENCLNKITRNEPELKRVKKVTKNCYYFLREYSWPGNLRQMDHALLLGAINANARCTTNTKSIDVCDVSSFLSKSFISLENNVSNSFDDSNSDFIPSNLTDYLEDLKQKFIRRALKITDGNTAKAAKLLGVSYQVLDYAKKTMSK